MYPSDISGPSRLPMSPLPDPPGPPTLTPVQQAELAERYAPIMYFHPMEENFLQDPNKFIEQSSLREDRHYMPDKEIRSQGNVTAEDLLKIGPKNDKSEIPKFLDNRDEDFDYVRDGDLRNSKNLYQYDAESNTLTYHFFYSYNDGAPGLGDAQNHEGDWEKVTIQLDDTLQPTAVRYSAHSNSSSERSWADAPNENGRPVVYVGKGSHVNVPTPGHWRSDSGWVQDEAVHGIRFDLRTLPTVDVTQEPWYGTHVQWGERGSLTLAGRWFGLDASGMTSGPTGPSESKGPILAGDADPNRFPTDDRCPDTRPRPTR
ncbi:Vps62-related protein [Lysobacter sp. Hz 25]|uniref:Vps62-related protein n=1 Tax=Lysobacter sp. Hz 25 TaxID=3383698 RepID=UPI0038D35A5A